MLAAAADKIKELLLDDELPFIEVIAGLVQTGMVIKNKTRYTFPVSCNNDDQSCYSVGHQKAIKPSPDKRSIIYFEDLIGMKPLKNKDKSVLYYSGTLRMVVWLNYAQMGITQQDLGRCSCSLSECFAVWILKTLKDTPKECIIEDGCFKNSALRFGLPVLNAKTPAIFAKYTSYGDDVTKCLQYPYDYFSIDIPVTMALALKCFEPPEIDEPVAVIEC